MAEIGFLSPRNDVDDDSPASFVPMAFISADFGVPHEHEELSWREMKKGYTHFAEGDVGVAKITPCFENGKSTVFRGLKCGVGAGTTELHVIRPILVDPDYLLIFLKSPSFIDSGIPKMTGTAGQKRLPADYFASAPLPLPPVQEQRRIVAKVGELMGLCDLLEAADNVREQCRDAARASFLHRLVSDGPERESGGLEIRRFLKELPRLAVRREHVVELRQAILDLAVRGRLVSQDPEDEPARALLERIAVQREELLARDFPNPSEAKTQRKKQRQQSIPSGLPQLPTGWQWATLMQCAALVVDCRNKTVPYTSAGVTLLRTTNIRHGRIVLDDHRYVSDATYEIWTSRYKPQPGDIVITREAPMGEVAKIPDGLTVCLGQRLMLARLVDGTVDPDFLVYSLRDSNLMGRIQDKPIGALVEHLRVGGVETLLIPLPPRAEQLRIVARVDQLMGLCDRLEAELGAAESRRESFLEAVIHGEFSQV